MKLFDGYAAAYFHRDFFRIDAMSQGLLNYADPDVPPFYLENDVNDETLGRTLRVAWGAGKKVSVDEFQQIYKSGAVQESGRERDAFAINKYGYKSQREMGKGMDCCWIRVLNGNVEIKPTHHNRVDGYTGISNDSSELINLPDSSSDQEIGIALREGFRRCTSIYR